MLCHQKLLGKIITGLKFEIFRSIFFVESTCGIVDNRVQSCSSSCDTVEIILKVLLLEGWCHCKRMGHGRSIMT